MKTAFRRSPLSSIPGYNENAVLQLIVASGSGFIMYHICRVTLLVAEAKAETFPSLFTDNLGLPALTFFGSKFWTILTYGWIHLGFWELFSNMIWLYCFGSIIQMLSGYKQIIPLFVYSLIIGGLFYEGAQLLPGPAFAMRGHLFGAQAGVVALAVGALTLSPNHRFYFTEHFSVPLVVIAVIFFALAIMNSNLDAPKLFLLAGGALSGFGYIKLMQNGYKPGAWPYTVIDRIGKIGTPDEQKIRAKQNHKRNEVLNRMQQNKNQVTQKRIDDILDKINQKGYNTLTKEEREILLNAGKDKE